MSKQARAMESVKTPLTEDDFPGILQYQWPPPQKIQQACKKDAMAIIIWSVQQTKNQAYILLEAAKAKYPNKTVCVKYGHVTLGYVP